METTDITITIKDIPVALFDQIITTCNKSDPELHMDPSIRDFEFMHEDAIKIDKGSLGELIATSIAFHASRVAAEDYVNGKREKLY